MERWLGPAGRDFFDGIYDVLQNRQEHCAVVIPERLQRSFRNALLRFGQDGYGGILIANLNPSEKLLANLEPEFCQTDEKVTSVAQLAERHLREGQILALQFPSNMGEWRREYFDYLKKFATEAKRRKDSGLPLKWSLICILPPGHNFNVDSGMRILEWWGRHYPSDLEFAIERALRPQNLSHPAYIWLYSIFRGLGNAAPDLVEYLAHSRLVDMETITSALAKHELCNQAIARIAKKYGAAKCSREQPPTGGALELWRAGALDIGCLDEPLLHPAVLVACDFKQRLANLIVTGQMQVYLPIAQKVFHWLMNRMRERFGPEWIKSCPAKPDGIGRLAWLLNNHFGNEVAKEAELARYWKDVRNNIAHAKIIPFNQALKAVLAYDRMTGVGAD